MDIPIHGPVFLHRAFCLFEYNVYICIINILVAVQLFNVPHLLAVIGMFFMARVVCFPRHILNKGNRFSSYSNKD